MAVSQLNYQIMLLLKRPLAHYWPFPYISIVMLEMCNRVVSDTSIPSMDKNVYELHTSTVWVKKTLHFENHLLFKIYALNMGMSDTIL